MVINISTLFAVGRSAGEDYMLRQLAEECAELAQAALKLVRARNGETPMGEAEAMARLIEEMADVSIMWDWAYWCMMSDQENRRVETVKTEKAYRMVDRILNGGGDGDRRPEVP